MLKIKLIVVGKIKEKFYQDAILEYSKRLSRFANLEIIELKDFPTPDNASDKENAQILEKEGKEILEKIGDGEYVSVLAIEGKQVSSPDIASQLASITTDGYSTIDFIIGGSLGISDEVKTRANNKISLGKITLPHQLARVVVLEQIYRGFMINAGSPYHK